MSAEGLVLPSNQRLKVGGWNTARCFFNAPDGYFELFVNGASAGKYVLANRIDAFDEFTIVSGTEFIKDPQGIMIDDVTITKIEPSTLRPGEPLKWTVCGPFSNKVDPISGERPYEKDFLGEMGGEMGIRPYPGMEIAYEGGNLTFSPFVTAAEHRKPDYFDFFKSKHLGYKQNQPDIITYAAAYVLALEAEGRTFVIGSDDYYHLWVNGSLVGKLNGWPIGHGCSAEGSERYQVKLNKGLNMILLKVDQGEGDYGFILRINK